MEERALWVVDAGELAPYLAAEWGWVGVAQVAWVRRRTQRHGQEHEQWVTVVTSQRAEQLPAAALLALVRAHWRVENRLHRVRDVTYDEDRLHGRRNGEVLAWGRNVALALIRKAGFRYLPEAFCHLSAQPDLALAWLMCSWQN